MTWLAERRYFALLASEAVLFLLQPALHRFGAGGGVTYRVLHTVAFLVAFLLFFEGKLRLTALLLGTPALLAAWTAQLAPGFSHGQAEAVFHCFATIFLGFVAAALLADIFRSSSVTGQSIYAAIGVYVLVAIVFAHLYSLAEVISPGAFTGSDAVNSELGNPTNRFFLLAYFSLSTLTTVGYGDVVPALDVVRSLAMLEAVTGQFYLAVLIAELVSRRAAAKSSVDAETKHR